MELPTSEAARFIAAKLRHRAELETTSKRTGPSLVPRNFSLFVKDLNASPREFKLLPSTL